MSDDLHNLSFYQSVIGDGVNCVVGLMDGRPPLQKFPTSLLAMMAQIESFNQQRRDVYFTVTGLAASGNRKLTNARSMRSLFVDLDCGPKKPYATQRDAATALMGFARAGAFPAPSWVVNTGGGLHAYWCADDTITPDEWQPVANALRTHMVATGLHIDGGITVDKVRIMRAPDTFNWKIPGNPRPTKILSPVAGKAPKLYTWDFLRAAFNAQPATSINTGIAASAPLSKAGMASVFNDSSGEDWEGWENPERARTGYRLENLQHHCPLIADIAATRGAGVPEPVWFRALALAAYCEDGEEWALGQLSDGYEGFTRSETEAKFKRTRDEASKPGNNFGPPTCKTFNSVSPICATCAHFPSWSEKPGYPWRGGALPVVQSDADGAIILPDDWMPPGFRRLPSGHIVALVQEDSEDSDGGTLIRTVEKEFTFDKLRDFQLVVKEVATRDNENTVRPCIKMASDSNPNAALVVDANRLSTGSSATLESLFVGAGLSIKLGGFEHMRRFSVELFEAMEANRLSAGIGYPKTGDAPMGFDADFKTFTINGRVLRKGQKIPNFASIPLITQNANEPTHKALMPVGTAEASHRAVRLFFRGAPAILTLAVAASLASPLLKLVGVPGFLLLMFSELTGSGKTTTLKTAASMWGLPSNTILGSGSSTLGHQHAMSKMTPMPVLLDEMRFGDSSGGKRLTPGAFDHLALKSLTEGKSGYKMQQSGAARAAQSWQSITIAASNDSLTTALASGDPSTLATTARTMEICPDDYMTGVFALDMDLNLGLDENGGFIGPEFAQIILDHYTREKLLKAIENAKDALMRRLGHAVVPPELRFRLPVMALALVAASICVKHGLLPFDIPELTRCVVRELKAFAETEQAEAAASDSRAVNVYDVLMGLALSQPALNITTLAGCAPLVPENTIAKARAHFDLDAGVVLMRSTTLRNDAREAGLSIGEKVRFVRLKEIGKKIGRAMDYKLERFGRGTLHDNKFTRVVVLEMDADQRATMTKMMRSTRQGLPTV